MSHLSHWSGPAAMMGGLLWLALWALNLLTYGPGPENRMERVLGLTSHDYEKLVGLPLLLVAVGVAGLHAGQRGRAGRLGTAGAATMLLGLAGIAAGGAVAVWPEPWGSYALSLAWPAVPAHAMIGWITAALSTLVVAVGASLLAGAVVRAGVWPRWVAAPLVLGALAAVPWGHGTAWGWVIGAAWVLIGAALWARRGQAAGGANGVPAAGYAGAS